MTIMDRRDEDLDDGDAFALEVGERLRAIRKSKGMSLDEAVRKGLGASASALGAWERNFRALSLPQLQRLAEFYGVPAAVLLGAEPSPGTGSRRLVFDLEALRRAPKAAVPVRRFIQSIIAERGDYNGRVLTIRGDDISAICAMTGVDTHAEAISQLDTWGVLLVV